MLVLLSMLTVSLGAGRMEVSMQACAGLSPVEVQRIASIELSNAPPLPTPLVARVTCAATVAELQVDDPVTRKTLMRRIDLAGATPKARPRTVALALAELVSASWSELLLPTPKAVEPVGRAPAPEVERSVRATLPAPADLSRRSLDASGVARVLPAASAVQWGAAVRGRWFPRGTWGLEAELGAERADVARTAGRVGLDSASLNFSGARWLRLREALDLTASAGLRLGVARVVGRPADEMTTVGGTVAGVWAGPRLGGDLGWKLGPLHVGLGAEVGYAVGRVTGEVGGETSVGIDGLWVELRITVGFAG